MKKLICLLLATISCFLTGCAEQKIDYPVSVDTDSGFVTTQESTYVPPADYTSAPKPPVETVESSQTVTSTDAVSSESVPISTPSSATPDESYVPVLPAPDTVEDLGNEIFLEYTSINSTYKPSDSNKHVYLYNFNTALSTGFGEDNIALPTEAFYGIKGNIDNRLLTVYIYDHTNSKSIKVVFVESLDECDSNYKKLSFTNGKLTLDTTDYHNGLYRILVDYTEKATAKLYFYVNGNKTWLCQVEGLSAKTAEKYAERRTALEDVINNGNVLPQNSLSLENVWYPYYEFDENYRCDTQKWIDLSNELVDDSWSDEYKLFTFASWLRDNIAYDDFVNKDLTTSRAQHYADYSGKYSVYNLRAGVCFDYANLLAIMCRAHNIPAISIGSTKTNHVWNAVYINNRWIEMDTTASATYHVGKDTTNRKLTNDDPYYGVYKILPISDNMPSDALANQFFQQNSYGVY